MILFSNERKGSLLKWVGLDARVVGTLERLVRAHPDARVSIEQPPMTEVFRRVLTEAGAAGA